VLLSAEERETGSHAVRGDAGIGERALVPIDRAALAVGHHHAQRHGIYHLAEPEIALALECLTLLLAQRGRLEPDGLLLEIEIDEHRHLAAQDLALKGPHLKIGSAPGVAVQNRGGVGVSGGEKNHRSG
jgi:hypothetical protein